MSCCGIKETIARIKADAVGNPIIEEADFVMVQYIGGNLQKHQVGSPTQVLRRDYGFQKNHYGQHKYGDVFAIHRDDLKKGPKLFKEIKVKVEKAEDELPPSADTKSDKPAIPPADDSKSAEAAKSAKVANTADGKADKSAPANKNK